MQSIYTYEDKTFHDSHAWHAYQTQCEAQSTAFYDRFGRPGERSEADVRAAVAAVRAAEPRPSSYAVPPSQAESEGNRPRLQRPSDPNRVELALPPNRFV